jgi:DNA-binding LacI/PurR family transcriptional regulator
MRRTTTIYDVAQEAGVSIATVSRVMNHPERVAAVTRDRILSAMKFLDFIPSIEASIRARSGLKRVGVIAPLSWSYSFYERLKGLNKALSPLDYEVITYSVADRLQLEHFYTMLSTGDRVDALVVMALPLETKALNIFRRRLIPLVIIEKKIELVPSIVSDNYRGGEMAARLLLRKGYRRFAFMGEGGHPEYITDSSSARYAGFSHLLGEAGFNIPANYVHFHYNGGHHTRQTALEILDLRPLPDAVFVSSDYEAMVLFRCAKNKGISVPGDMAIMGYDNIEASAFLGLSTIDQHLERSGTQAAETLKLAFRGSYDRIPNVVELPLEVMERETT